MARATKKEKEKDGILALEIWANKEWLSVMASSQMLWERNPHAKAMALQIVDDSKLLMEGKNQDASTKEYVDDMFEEISKICVKGHNLGMLDFLLSESLVPASSKTNGWLNLCAKYGFLEGAGLFHSKMGFSTPKTVTESPLFHAFVNDIDERQISFWASPPFSLSVSDLDGGVGHEILQHLLKVEPCSKKKMSLVLGMGFNIASDEKRRVLFDGMQKVLLNSIFNRAFLDDVRIANENLSVLYGMAMESGVANEANPFPAIMERLVSSIKSADSQPITHFLNHVAPVLEGQEDSPYSFLSGFFSQDDAKWFLSSWTGKMASSNGDRTFPVTFDRQSGRLLSLMDRLADTKRLGPKMI